MTEKNVDIYFCPVEARAIFFENTVDPYQCLSSIGAQADTLGIGYLSANFLSDLLLKVNDSFLKQRPL